MSQSNETLSADAARSPDVSRAQSEVVKVGLIIVDYHCWSDTRGAVASALKSRRHFDRIIVVDNGGAVPEDECQVLSKRITLIRAPRNGGFAYGVNIGLRCLAAEGATHAMVLNPDARLGEETLETLLRALDQHPDVGIVGPLVFSDDAQLTIDFAGAKTQWHLGRLPHRKVLRKPGADLCNEPFITGCCWLMKMELLKRVGELPEGYFLYFEDTDYCQSVQRSGFRVSIVPGARAVHYGNRIVKRHSPLFRYHVARSRVWFMRRWARPDQYASFLIFTVLVKMPVALLLFGLLDRDWPALSAFLRGTWHGLTLPVFATQPESVSSDGG